MFKNELREYGFSETERYQKASIITAIWLILSIILITAIFVFTSLFGQWKNSEVEFFDNINKITASLRQIFHGWLSSIYLLLWVLIFVILFFMLRFNSHEQKFLEKAKISKLRWVMLRFILIFLILTAIFLYFLLITEYQLDVSSGGSYFDIFDFIFNVFYIFGYVSLIIYLILWEFIYLALKLILTIFVCPHKERSIKLRILKGTAMPVCSCQEAFNFRDIIITYLIPVIIVYSSLFKLCVNADEPDKIVIYMIVNFFMSFFMSFDLTLVIYTIFLKIRYRMNYISINHHIYEVTLFKKSYIKEKH